MNNLVKTIPFLRWPGGKRWLAERLCTEMLKHQSGQYFEPFIGGGAVFFSLAPKRAYLSDINSELINAYKFVKNDPDHLLTILKKMPSTREHYYLVRSRTTSDPIMRAANLIYLNRLAFSGMYRVNREGQFNVPYGGDHKLSALWDDDLILNASKALKGVRLKSCDFEEMISRAKEDDLVYCDPTYTVMHNDNGFVRYNERVFSWEDQKRLADVCMGAAKRGAIVYVSNAAHREIQKLYKPFTPRIISRRSSVSAKVTSRQDVEEFLFRLHL